MSSLACRYRPQSFEDVCGQKSIVQILTRQLELNEIKNCYLFCGPSGCGKTTIGRILANKINKGQGSPIEIDGASNNGVDNVRLLIDSASQRSIDSEYKIFIIDECHQITTAAWNAFLKTIEEPPKYTIFIFCTTDPQKIPATILNRVMRFNLSKVPMELIKNRLLYVCENEHFKNYIEACDYISKLSNGGVRDALALLEKAASYSEDLNMNNVLECLGNFSYNAFIDLTTSILINEESIIMKIINHYYDLGKDLKMFLLQYLDFIYDVEKYSILRNMSVTKIPSMFEANLQNIISNNNIHTISYGVLNILYNLKNDSMPQLTIPIQLIEISRKLKTL